MPDVLSAEFRIWPTIFPFCLPTFSFHCRLPRRTSPEDVSALAFPHRFALLSFRRKFGSGGMLADEEQDEGEDEQMEEEEQAEHPGIAEGPERIGEEWANSGKILAKGV